MTYVELTPWRLKTEMIVDITEDKLSIKQSKHALKLRHISQLGHWGFSRSPDEDYLLLNDNIEFLLPKVLRYFNKSKIEYTLSPSCQNLIKEIQVKADILKKILEAGKNFKDGIYDKESFDEHVQFLSNNIIRNLKDHQIKASFHLYLIGNGANFSVPGSGKTTVVLSVYEKLRLQEKVNTLFVVGPPACFGPWKAEFKSVLGRDPNYSILAGGNRIVRKSEYYRRDNIYDLYLTTFQTLLNDLDEVCIFLSNKNVNAYFIIDEAHYIKQIDGNWANAVLKAAVYSEYRCVLTGTPIPKSYSDLYNLFDFLVPDNPPIGPAHKIKLQLLEEEKDYEHANALLESNIGPLFYRVRKSELGLQPQVFHEPEIIRMNPYERKIYDAIIQKISTYAKDDFLKNIELVVKLRRGRMIRLRQCLSYTKLLDTAIDDYDEDVLIEENDLKYSIINYDELEAPAKLNYLIDMVKKFQRIEEKIVIWAHFIGAIKLIERKLKEEGFYCKKIIGETPVEKTLISEEETREKIINEFVNSKSGLDILLANPAACSESISLHKTCHNAVYYDLSYNCAQYLQSLDRIHRVGGSEEYPAHYYFLHYADTIDPDILLNLKTKARKMYQVIEGDYNIYSLDMFEDSDELAAYERIFYE